MVELIYCKFDLSKIYSLFDLYNIRFKKLMKFKFITF
jgi:hypothetical protein